ncbi:hypothetical protein SAMN05216321_11430 [Cupriavidus sp. OV038]|jgi:hypothetical protein|uniref:hypothetical protein n=1 Tax=unclassified Cupriavidus TaxID=2640874 RepID=UPI0008DEEE6D|nr:MULTISPECIES: hypothetical protein [unclassified Cupriavidus]SFD22220.1 hypothetical protein SAMN05216321_11430 [Cupriavidus sp. OV038]SFP91576.1 hypothetical protein SAMN05216322_11331 [Cupriavidus sp. OV096]
MSPYEALRDRFFEASTREKDHRALLESVARSTSEKLAAYLQAPPALISVKPTGEPGPKSYGFRYVVTFDAGDAVVHSAEVPVVMTLTRHGLHARVADGHDQHVGDPAHPDWHEVFYDVLTMLEKDCQATERQSQI